MTIPDDELEMDPQERDQWLNDHENDPEPETEVLVETEE